jgi:hypothetical protein
MADDEAPERAHVEPPPGEVPGAAKEDGPKEGVPVDEEKPPAPVPKPSRKERRRRFWARLKAFTIAQWLPLTFLVAIIIALAWPVPGKAVQSLVVRLQTCHGPRARVQQPLHRPPPR